MMVDGHEPQWVILSVDPGQRTGIAVTSFGKIIDPAQPSWPTHQLINGYGLKVDYLLSAPYNDAAHSILDLARAARKLAGTYGLPGSRIAVVVEHFTVTRVAMQSNSTWSSEVTGMAKAVADIELPGHRWDKTQKPADMKPVVLVPRVLHAMGIRKRGDMIDKHVTDALGHAVLFAARARNGSI